MRIKVTPKPGTDRNISGFPHDLIGADLIELRLKYSTGESAIYRDSLGEEYTISGPSRSEWWIEVRED